MELISKIIYFIYGILFFCNSGTSVNLKIDTDAIYTFESNFIDLKSSTSPLVLKIEKIHTTTKIQEFLYPNEIYRMLASGSFVSLVCTAPAKISNLESSFKNSMTLFLKTAIIKKQVKQQLYLTDTSEEFFPNATTPITCDKVIEPSMIYMKDKEYRIGYQINPFDFLSVINIFYTYNPAINVVAYMTFKPILFKRIEYKGDTTFKTGLKYRNNGINLSEIYNKDFQLIKLKEIIDDKTLRNKYTTGDNYFVEGQLITMDYLYYISEQRCTLFYENTIPIWKSINDGNKKLVDNIIRDVAHKTFSNFDIYSGTIGDFFIGGNKIGLHYPDLIVPHILFKIAVDSSNFNRGVVFYTINDPFAEFDPSYIHYTKGYEKIVIACEPIMDCHFEYPDFLNVTRGYTICCDAKSFDYWNDIKKNIKNVYDDD